MQHTIEYQIIRTYTVVIDAKDQDEAEDKLNDLWNSMDGKLETNSELQDGMLTNVEFI